MQAQAQTQGRDEAYLDSLVVHLTGFESEAECSQRLTEYKRITQAEYRARHSAGAGRSGGPRRKRRKFHPLIYACSAYKGQISTGRSTASRQRKQQVQYQQQPQQHSATASIFGGLA